MSVISCIGCGNMGFALMKGAGRGTEIFITDTDSEKVKIACRQLEDASIKASIVSSNTEAIEKADIVFLAVKPQVLKAVLSEISHAVKNKKGKSPVLVSMAAGWSIEKIQSAISEETQGALTPDVKAPVVRIMPNTPALIGKGMILMSSSPEVPPEKIDELEKLLMGAGMVDRINEQYMNAVTGLSGSGPAFVYLFIDALADGGVSAGLSRDKAIHYAVQTVLGAAAMITETGKEPSELTAMVTSPGGTTLAGIAALEDGAFQKTVKNAVQAAWKRAIELG